MQTVQDIIDAREAWIAEGRRPLIGAEYDAGQASYYAPATGPFVQPSLPPAAPPYINHLVIDAICAKDGQSAFNVTKLLKLIEELNDNYARENTYASHALLRGLLDHIPPILGCKSFDEVANNYHWSKTDKNYTKHLANFRTQGDAHSTGRSPQTPTCWASTTCRRACAWTICFWNALGSCRPPDSGLETATSTWNNRSSYTSNVNRTPQRHTVAAAR